MIRSGGGCFMERIEHVYMVNQEDYEVFLEALEFSLSIISGGGAENEFTKGDRKLARKRWKNLYRKAR